MGESLSIWKLHFIPLENNRIGLSDVYTLEGRKKILIQRFFSHFSSLKLCDSNDCVLVSLALMFNPVPDTEMWFDGC